MAERRSVLGDLNWFQVIAGALAAMTAAWLASALGVAGTIIGAAIASLTVTISSALYARTLDKSRVLVVRTERGTTIEKRIEPGETAEAMDAIASETSGPVAEAEVEDRPRRLSWKTVGITTALVLVLSFGAMGAYELASGDSYGVNPDNARIGNPLGGGSGTTDSDTDAPDPDPTPSATTDEPTEPTPSATTPTPTPTATTPTPTPTATATPEG